MKKDESKKSRDPSVVAPAQPGAPLPPPFDPDYEIIGYLENPEKLFFSRAKPKPRPQQG